MKTKLILPCLAIALLSAAFGAKAQNLTVLANFNGGNGANPQSTLVALGGTLYGTTFAGGTSNFGTVFAINTNGGTVSTLYSFVGATYDTNASNYVTTDGANPVGGLVLSGSTFYGTTSAGGSSGNGTVFAVNTNGVIHSIIHHFTGGSGGAVPEAGLLLSGSTLYGTTYLGGTSGEGSVFRVNINSTAFTNIHSFTGGSGGANPVASLVLSGNALYGTTFGSSSGQSGTVFRVNTDGSSFSNVYTFTGGSDGANPAAGLVLAGGALYGTASEGGNFLGTVFQVNTNGSGFASYLFDGNNGANPQAGLLLLGNTLFGTAANGGSNGWGTIFQINTNGGSFTNLYAFTYGSDGATPEAGLVLAGNRLYGTTEADDPYGYGSVFGFLPSAVPVTLNIALTGSQVTLTWPDTAFSLQAATNLTATFTNVPGAASPYTNSATSKQQFFRLKE